MTLLSPLALLLGLTALVPLILHLYQRRRRTVIEFSTNRFFTAAIIRSQRRLRLRRLLLLMLRMATCLLLALALARPILNLAGLGRAGSRDVVILLDDSLSMQASETSTGEQHTRFDQARRVAIDVLHELSSGDRAAVITFTGRALGPRTRTGPQLTGDLLSLAGELERLSPTAAGGDAHAALALAAELFEQPGPRHRRLLVLSDLQETDWRQSDWPAPPHRVGAAIVPLSPPTTDNVVADQMVLSQGTAVAGQPNLLRVRLVNHRPETTSVEMVLRVDDEERVRRPLELPGGSPHVERIPLIFERPGEHRLSLSVELRPKAGGVPGVTLPVGPVSNRSPRPVRSPAATFPVGPVFNPSGDALAADNTLFATVTVNPQLSVLLVDGQAQSGARQSAALYLRAAMRAIGSAGDSMLLEVVDPADLPGVTLDSHWVVILSAVKELPLPQVERLEHFVQSGGGLGVFLGEGADRGFYNDLLGGQNRPLGGLLPAEVRDLLDTEGAERSLSLIQADLDHPMLQRFKGTLRSALAGIRVYRAYAVVPREAWIVAALDRQWPLIVERSYGRGKVILFTAPPEPRWTNLPLRRAFLPLISRMISYLAGGGTGGAEHAVGEEMVLLRGGWDVEQPVYALRPDGTRVRAAVSVVGAEPLALLPAEAVSQPGFYELELPAGARHSDSGAPHTVRAVNVPRSESDPHVLDIAEAQRLAGNWRLQTVELAGRAAGAVDEETIAAVLAGGPGGRGVWDVLLWAVLMFVLLEPLLANRIIGSRTTDEGGASASRRHVTSASRRPSPTRRTA